MSILPNRNRSSDSRTCGYKTFSFFTVLLTFTLASFKKEGRKLQKISAQQFYFKAGCIVCIGVHCGGIFFMPRHMGHSFAYFRNEREPYYLPISSSTSSAPSL